MSCEDEPLSVDRGSEEFVAAIVTSLSPGPNVDATVLEGKSVEIRIFNAADDIPEAWLAAGWIGTTSPTDTVRVAQTTTRILFSAAAYPSASYTVSARIGGKEIKGRYTIVIRES